MRRREKEWCRGRREGYLGRFHVVIVVGVVDWNEGSGYAHIVVALVEGERDGGRDAPGIVGKGSSREDDLSEVQVAAWRWQVGGNKVGECYGFSFFRTSYVTLTTLTFPSTAQPVPLFPFSLV